MRLDQRPVSERDAACQNRGMMIGGTGGTVGNRYLIAESHSDTDAFMDRETADDEAGSQKHLSLALMLPIGPPGVVYLEFRPEIL